MRSQYIVYQAGSAKASSLLLLASVLLAVTLWNLVSESAWLSFFQADSVNMFVVGLIGCLILVSQLLSQGYFSSKLILLLCAWLLICLFATNESIIAIWLQSAWWLIFTLVALRSLFKVNHQTSAVFAFLFIALVTSTFAQFILSTKLLNDQSGQLAHHLSRATILISALLVSSITSQLVSPNIKANLSTTHIARFNFAELVLLISALVATSSFISGYFLALPISPGILMIGVGCMHILRVIYWSVTCCSTPSLWLLKLMYIMMALCLILLGCSYFNLAILFDSALHLIALSLVGQASLAIFVSFEQSIVKPIPSRKLLANRLLVVALTTSQLYQFNEKFINPIQIPSLASFRDAPYAGPITLEQITNIGVLNVNY